MREKSKTIKKKSIKKRTQSDFKDALLKKALGYDYEEVVEEYVSDGDGEIKLTKKKVTTKNVPPDISALKILLEESPSISQMTDEQLEEEKTRLLKSLEKLTVKENR